MSGNGRQSPIAAFSHRNYRYLWLATMFGSAGRWMENVLFSWFVLQMTGSPFLVGAVAACRWLGYGFGPVAGAIADRYDKRRILLIVTWVSVLYGSVLAVGMAMDGFQYWHVMAIALFAGVSHGFDMPLRHAFTASIVSKSILANAVALNTMAIEVTAILGPAAAGLLINGIGMSGVAWVLVAIYLFNVMMFFLIQDAPAEEKAAKGSVSSDLKAGIRYIGGNPAVFALLSMTVVFSLFQWPLRHALAPVFASKVLHLDAGGYGFILAASGVGALSGAVAVAFLGDFRHKAWLCIAAAMTAGIAALAFSLSTRYGLSLGIMVFLGLAEAIFSTMAITLLLLVTPAEMRGWIMGVRSLTILPLFLGSLIAGAMAGHFDAPTAGAANAALQILAIVLIAALVPSLRKVG
jgi:MFS family permease